MLMANVMICKLDFYNSLKEIVNEILEHSGHTVRKQIYILNFFGGFH